jgi:hypothetical protein
MLPKSRRASASTSAAVTWPLTESTMPSGRYAARYHAVIAAWSMRRSDSAVPSVGIAYGCGPYIAT